MDDIKYFKEKLINDFIYNNINLKSAESPIKLSVKDIKSALKNALGEEPAVKFNYKENVRINETTKKVERLNNELESIEIYYTYIGSDNLPHASHMKYIVN
jgi:hypothetical protein